MNTKLIPLLIAIFASGIFASCQKENSPVATPEDPESHEYYVFVHDTFDEDDDVQIISADTTTISVSLDYINKLGYKFNASEAKPIPVTIWKTINTAPFIRNIVATAEEGDRMILTTKPGDIGDVFGDVELTLDTQIYIDHSQPKSVTRSGVTTENYDRYTDAEGVVHPAIIILDEMGNCNDELPSAVKAASAPGEAAYFTPEDIERSNGSISFGIIDKHWELGNFSLTSPDESLKIYLNNTSFGINSNLRFIIETGFFKLKRFECALYGNMSFNTTTGIEVKGSLNSFKKEEELAKFNCFTTVFMVGVVPVSISCNAGLQFVANADVSATGKFEAEYVMNAPYEIGVLYNDNGWSGIYNANLTSEFKNYNITLQGGAEASVGIEAFAELKLYSAAGPKITFGPHATAGVSGSYNAVAERLDFSTSGKVSLGGEYGVEVKIWKWSLAAWKHKYSVFEMALWDFKDSIPFSAIQ